MRVERCCTPALQSRGSVLRRARALLALAPAATLALLIPKCPLCLAADLALLGATAAALGRALLPVLCATGVALAAAVLLGWLRANRNRGQRDGALIRQSRTARYSLTSPRAKMLATKESTSLAEASL